MISSVQKSLRAAAYEHKKQDPPRMGKALSAHQPIRPLHSACLYFALVCRLQTYMLKAARLFSVSVSGKHFSS